MKGIFSCHILGKAKFSIPQIPQWFPGIRPGQLLIGGNIRYRQMQMVSRKSAGCTTLLDASRPGYNTNYNNKVAVVLVNRLWPAKTTPNFITGPGS